MSEKKVNLLDLQREYGITSLDEPRLNSIRVLTFWESDDGGVMSRLPSGGVVFRHKDGGLSINAGETWVVELIEKGTTHFAVGVQKLDSKFFFDLRNDQIDEIAEVIWRNNKALIEPRFEERIRQKYDQDLQEAVNKATSDVKMAEEEALARAEELKKELDAQSIKHKMIVSSLEEELHRFKSDGSRGAEMRGEPSDDPPAFGLQMPYQRPPRIRRTEPDTLQSDDFNSRHYFVHVSSDQSVMTIRSHDEGNVVCLDRKMQLKGLSLISPYNGPTDMPAEYSPRYGGFVVMLKHSPGSVGAVNRASDA